MNKKLSCLGAVLSACLVLSACGGSGATTEVKKAKAWEYEQPVELVYDCLGGDGTVMPILGFWCPPRDAVYNGQFFPDFSNDAFFTATKEAGINLLMQANDDAVYYEDKVELMLDLCDKYGMGYYVTDTSLFSISSGSVSISREAMTDKIEEYAKHRGFAGMYFIDEPTRNAETVVRNEAEKFYSIADELQYNIHPYVNLNPYWAGAYKNDLNIYTEHVESILKDDHLRSIAYDIYPNRAAGFNYEWLFTNISVIRKSANDHGIAWIPFVEAGGESDRYVVPDEGMLTFNTNIYLAFGAKGINYFPICSPISFADYVEQGTTVAMFDWFGNKTETYYYVKEVNKQIAAVDEYLMKATNHGVIMNEAMPNMDALKNGELIEAGTFRELTAVTGDSVTVGCFDYFGKTCLYVVNNDMAGTASAELSFDGRYGYDVIQRGVKAGVTGTKIPLTLAAGEGAFILLK